MYVCMYVGVYVCMYVCKHGGAAEGLPPNLAISYMPLALDFIPRQPLHWHRLCTDVHMYVCSGDPQKPIGGLGLFGLLLGHGSHQKKGKWGACLRAAFTCRV